MAFVCVLHELFTKTETKGLVFEISQLDADPPLLFVRKGEEPNWQSIYEPYYKDWKMLSNGKMCPTTRIQPTKVSEGSHLYTCPTTITVWELVSPFHPALQLPPNKPLEEEVDSNFIAPEETQPDSLYSEDHPHPLR
jgi:hypothetical protein